MITHNELLDFFRRNPGTTIATIETDTDPRLKKTGNPYRNVRKLSRLSVLFGFSYENAVNNQRAREGNEEVFSSGPRLWGQTEQRDNGSYTPIIEKDGEYYLQCKVQNTLSVEYRDENGSIIPVDRLEQFLPKVSATNQGVEKEVVIRTFKVSSIKSIKAKGIEESIND